MSDSRAREARRWDAAQASTSASTPALTELIGDLSRFDTSTADGGTDLDAARIDRIRVLEELKGAVAAAQARETAAFAASQRAVQQAAGVPAERAGRGIAEQVALARRLSPFHARRYTGWAGILTRELPQTFAELAAGRTSEWRAMIVARETAWLSREHRAAVDRELAPRLAGLGDRKVEAEAKRLAYRLDPAGYVNRVRGANSDRRVSLRPAPDTMCRLTGFLPVAQGVAAHTALAREADALRAAGDQRSRGQIMADLYIERLTGQSDAGDVPVEINLIMTDQALFGGSHDTDTAESTHDEPGAGQDDAGAAEPTAPEGRDEPAVLVGYGPIPAQTARDLIHGPSGTTPMWIRRLFTRPGTGQLAAMDSRRRLFTSTQRHYLTVRDQICRTPYCDAPIRHTDHVIPYEHGGPTSTENGQGACVACNHAKQAPGWRATTTTGGAVVITTPTGHTYQSRPPDPPGTRSADPPSVQLPQPVRLPKPQSPVEARFRELLRIAA